jgi:uncharacterized damage-inducible protein DinB
VAIKTMLMRQFQYDDWANRAALLAVESDSNLDPRTGRIASHVLAAAQVWLARVQGMDAAQLQIWPDLSAADRRALLDENKRGFNAFFAGCRGDTLNAIVSYRNSQGIAFRTATTDILTQVLLHGAYHRGQIAVAVKKSSGTVLNIDYITFVRQN